MTEQLASIRAFIEAQVPNVKLTDDEDIFATGYVNSLFAVQLVMRLQDRFDIAFADADLDIQNFRSIAAVDRVVTRCRAAASLGS